MTTTYRVVCGLAIAALGPLHVAAQGPPAPSRARGATWWSLGATVMPMTAGLVVTAAGGGGTAETAAFATLFWGGAVIGPGAGFFHGRSGQRGLPGIVIRVGAFAFGSLVSPTTDFDDGFYPNPEWDGSGAPWGMWPLAAGVIAISAAADIARVRSVVLRTEARRITVMPLIDRRTRRVGLVLTR